MNRFDQVRLYFEMMCGPGEDEARAMADLFDPNVTAMIQQGTEPPIEMAVAYWEWKFENGEKPFWFQLSTEGAQA